MKLKFENLEYQAEAIDAIVSIFEGQELNDGAIVSSSMVSRNGLTFNELGTANALTLHDDIILDNIKIIQEKNAIEKSDDLMGKNFTIEMETGTGKTYVYLRTIYELNKKFGFAKFCIVVPSVAIREGVLNSIKTMKEHFDTLYNNTPCRPFVYDSKKLGEVRQFAGASAIQIMIINIQSFQKDIDDKLWEDMTDEERKKANVFNRPVERMEWHSPRDFVKSANPIVIIDEPQSVDNTPKAKKAIANLNPLCILRYSATHREQYNLMYQLDPIKAYDLKLVKRIEVLPVISEGAKSDAYIKLLKTTETPKIKAQIEINEQTKDGINKKSLWVSKGDNIYEKSKENPYYMDGFIVRDISCIPGKEYIDFDNGVFVEPGTDLGGLSDEIMKEQVRATVEEHLKKERALSSLGIKVLSLFFIDRVANYRIYNDDGSTSLGKIGLWFEEAYNELIARPVFKSLNLPPVGTVHKAYFSQDKTRKFKDTNGNTKDDDDAYNLIMKEKERLLSIDEPVRFIFSHSALREGWDNPNVFQICTLNERGSIITKRQEIGRGLRLPVNSKGERVHDNTINRLTVIANESYASFAKALQTEFEEETGIKFGIVKSITFSGILAKDETGENKPIGQDISKQIYRSLQDNNYVDETGRILERFNPKLPDFELKIDDKFDDLKPQIIDEINKYVFSNRVINLREKKAIHFKKEVFLSDDFKELWTRISQKTRYRVAYETDKLIKAAAEEMHNMPQITALKLVKERAKLNINKAGIEATATDRQEITVSQKKKYPDLLAFLQKETELTRTTLYDIVCQSKRLKDYIVNPQAFMTESVKAIRRALARIIIHGIQYEKIDAYYDQSQIEADAEKALKDEIKKELRFPYHVQNENRALYDTIECDSEVERRFAKDLDNNEHVKLFVKLPSWFKIPTPIGDYNPDWAFVTERDGKLYFVRETKGTTDQDFLRVTERDRIECGKAHFKTLGVDFGVVTELKEVVF